MKGEQELAAEQRRVQGKQVRRLRREGLVPAILYGGRGPSVSLQISREALQQILRRHGGLRLLDLKVGTGRPTTVMVKQMQFAAITGELLHVDFFRVEAREKVKAKVPLHFVGESPADESPDLAVTRPMSEVLVESYPQDLPGMVEVDMSLLSEPNSTLRVEDLDAGENVAILNQPDQVIASVTSVAKKQAEVPEAGSEALEIAGEEAERAAGGAEMAWEESETATEEREGAA